MSELRKTPFHRALHRPNMMLGGERTPMIVAVSACGILIVSSMNLVALVVGVIMCIFLVSALRRMAKKDPQMVKIYGRQRSYRAYYHPYSRPSRVAEKGRREY